MATTKSTAKKAVKKPAKKVAASTKSTAKSTRAKQPKRRIVGYDAHPNNFFKVQVTIQTVYWAIIAALVLALGIWIITLQIQVHKIYDAIEANDAASSALTPQEIEYLKERIKAREERENAAAAQPTNTASDTATTPAN